MAFCCISTTFELTFRFTLVILTIILAFLGVLLQPTLMHVLFPLSGLVLRLNEIELTAWCCLIVEFDGNKII